MLLKGLRDDKTVKADEIPAEIWKYEEEGIEQ